MRGHLLHLTVKPWANCKLGALIINYFKTNNQENFTADGWFKTGDVSTIDPDGGNKRPHQRPHQSGGEWISRCT
jgi:fatty-acyl-CoA synthase